MVCKCVKINFLVTQFEAIGDSVFSTKSHIAHFLVGKKSQLRSKGLVCKRYSFHVKAMQTPLWVLHLLTTEVASDSPIKIIS